MRNDVNPKVEAHYSPDKEFFISFVDSYIVEAILDHFNMVDVFSKPECDIPENVNDRMQWTTDHFTALVKTYVGTFVYRKQGTVA